MKTILAAIDFSPASRRVVDEAVRLAQAFHGKIVVVHVVQPPPVATDVAPLVGEVLQLTSEIERASRASLRRLEARLAKRRIAIETRCQLGVPVEAILDWAKKLRADAIVIGSHGHSALYDLVMGGTARAILKRASVPVVVIPAVRKHRAQPRRRAAGGRKALSTAMRAS